MADDLDDGLLYDIGASAADLDNSSGKLKESQDGKKEGKRKLTDGSDNIIVLKRSKKSDISDGQNNGKSKKNKKVDTVQSGKASKGGDGSKKQALPGTGDATKKKGKQSSKVKAPVQDSEISSGSAIKEKKKKKKPKKTEEASQSICDTSSEAAVVKKRRKKRKSITKALAKQAPLPLVPFDLISAINSFYKPTLSSVELDEVQLSVENLALCNDMTHTETSFLKTLAPHWRKELKQEGLVLGSPLILVVCASGLRCVEFIRAIPDFKIEGWKVSKLFAKHLKIQEQEKFLKSRPTHIGVATPHRLSHLLDDGSLRLEHTRYVMFDWSHRDIKSQRMIDILAVKEGLMALLKQFLVERIKEGKLKIGLF